jgi:hypothetical protein
METFSLHSLWQKAKRGDWIVGLRWEMPGEEQLWEDWIRAAARAGHRLLYFLGVTQLAVSSFPCHHDSRSNPPPARGGQANESTQV